MVVIVTSELHCRSALFERHKALGARFVSFAGWEMPVQYQGIGAEHRAVRTAAGLFDVSHMGELVLSGPGATAALDRLVTGDIQALAQGRACYTLACNERGTILDDLIVYRIGSERFLVVCNAGNRAKISGHFERETRGRCEFADASDDYGLLALQGPHAQRILAGRGAPRAALELERFGVMEVQLEGMSMLVARTGYTGEDGFELFCPVGQLTRLWDALVDAGEPLGLLPIGLGARDTLRLEARLMLYGNEIDETTHPFEAGLGWTVRLGKPEFIGQAALQRIHGRIAERGLERRLVGFEMQGRGIARHGYPIVDATRVPVGVVTSGAPSLTLGKNIGLGYAPASMSKLGTVLGIEIRGQIIEAAVVSTPFYKRGS
jgi:aminomethyltransferase